MCEALIFLLDNIHIRFGSKLLMTTSLIAWSIVFTLQNSKIRPTSQIPRPHFWIYIYLYRMFLLRLKVVINEMTLILIFLDGDVSRSASNGVYISQLIRFARVSSHVDDFNTRYKVLTSKLLRQGYRYHKLCKAFSKYYRRHFDFWSNNNVGLKALLLQGLSEPEFYGDLVYKFRKKTGKYDV